MEIKEIFINIQHIKIQLHSMKNQKKKKSKDQFLRPLILKLKEVYDNQFPEMMKRDTIIIVFVF